jgi:hypothetical protein
MRARAARRKACRAVQAVRVPRERQSGGDRATGHQAALVGVLSGWGRSIPSGQGKPSGQRSLALRIIWFARRIVGDIPASILSKVSQLPVARREAVFSSTSRALASLRTNWAMSASLIMHTKMHNAARLSSTKVHYFGFLLCLAQKRAHKCTCLLVKISVLF